MSTRRISMTDLMGGGGDGNETDTKSGPEVKEPPRLVTVKTDRLLANPHNPRDDLGGVSDLASIKERQQQSLLCVTKGAYLALYPDEVEDCRGIDLVVINGNRRLAAAREYGRDELFTIIDDGVAESRVTLMRAAYNENVDRRDFDPIEEAKAMMAIVSEYETQKDAAAAQKWSPAVISHRKNLLRIHPDLQEQVRVHARTKKGGLAVHIARRLGGVDGIEDMTLERQEAEIERIRAEDAAKNEAEKQQKREAREAKKREKAASREAKGREEAAPKEVSEGRLPGHEAEKTAGFSTENHPAPGTAEARPGAADASASPAVAGASLSEGAATGEADQSERRDVESEGQEAAGFSVENSGSFPVPEPRSPGTEAAVEPPAVPDPATGGLRITVPSAVAGRFDSIRQHLAQGLGLPTADLPGLSRADVLAALVEAMTESETVYQAIGGYVAARVFGTGSLSEDSQSVRWSWDNGARSAALHRTHWVTSQGTAEQCDHRSAEEDGQCATPPVWRVAAQPEGDQQAVTHYCGSHLEADMVPPTYQL